MNIECPACHSELDPSNTQCPVCLRPRSRHEMMQSLQAGRREQKWARRKPLYAAAALVICVMGGYGYKKLRGAKASPPRPAVAKQSPEPLPHSATAQQAPLAPSPASPTQAPVPAPAPPPPDDPDPPSDWMVSGTVYDILTLRPAVGARLGFENRAIGEVFKAKTDSRGRYRVRLPKLTDGGYWVSISAKGYRGDYLEEASPPFTSRTRAGREDALAEAAQTNILHVPIFLDNETSLEYNLALLPRE